MPRLFIDIELPLSLIAYIQTIQKILLATNYFKGTFVDGAKLHVTIVFIGEVSDDQCDAVKQALRSIAVKSFEVCTNALSVFSEHDPRIIWLGVMGDGLQKLIDAINDTLKTLSFVKQKQEENFVGHITLVRIKELYKREELLALIKQFDVQKYCFFITSFTLKQSLLLPKEAQHDTIEQY